MKVTAEHCAEERRLRLGKFQNGDRAFLQNGLRERFFLRGADLRVREGSTTHRGIAEDVGPRGELLLRIDARVVTIVSGEVIAWERSATKGV